MSQDQTAQLHASAVSVDGKGCLILGKPGSGKSTLALGLIALGALLIADDQVILTSHGGQLHLSAPSAMHGVIEARGVGLIRLDGASQQVLSDADVICRLVVDLDQRAERLPRPADRDLLGIPCPVILGKDRSGFAAIIWVLMHSDGLLDPEQNMKI